MNTGAELVVKLGFVTQLATASMLALAGPELTADTRLLGVCLAGSLMGGFLAVAIRPPRCAECEVGTSLRQLAVHFVASCFAGIVFTPVIVEHMGWNRTGDTVLGVSAAVALFAVGIISALYPKVARWAMKMMSGGSR